MPIKNAKLDNSPNGTVVSTHNTNSIISMELK